MMPLPSLVDLPHHVVDDGLGLARLEVEGVEIGGENPDVALAEIGDHLGRMLQCREAEERRGRCAERPFHRAETLFDFFLALRLGQFLVVEVGVRPGVRADGVSGGGHLLEDFRIIGRVLADREENRLGALLGQGLQHRGRIDRPRAVVERQHHFLVAQEIELLEMLEAETGAAGGVDFHDAADAQRVRVGASGFRGRRGGRWCRGGSRGWRGSGGSLRCRTSWRRGLRPCCARCTQRNRARKDQTCRNTHLISLKMIPCPGLCDRPSHFLP